MKKVFEYLYQFVRGFIIGVSVAAGLSFVALGLIAIKYWIWG